jgi:hypothetical protein
VLLSPPVCVGPVIDVEHTEDAGRLVDLVPDSVLPASGPPLTFEGLAKRCPDLMRPFGERPEDELDAGDSYRLW